MTDFASYCKDRHDVFANQKYDGNIPYSKHLEYVVAQVKRFKYLICDNSIISKDYSKNDYTAALAAAWGHDLIEDTRLTYNDLVGMVGERVAGIIYKCSEEKGRTREERHAIKYYLELREDRLAVFVKLCDIIGNVTYSVLTKSDMYDKQKKEHEKTKEYLYREEFKDMFDFLDKLFSL